MNDKCKKCEKEFKICDNAKELMKDDENYIDGYNCDKCKKHFHDFPMTHCTNCLIDYCKNCKPVNEVTLN